MNAEIKQEMDCKDWARQPGSGFPTGPQLKGQNYVPIYQFFS